MCQQCGTRAAEWDENAGGDEDAYTAVEHRCVGCQVIADKQAGVPKRHPGDDAHGVRVALIPTPVHAALQIAREHEANNRKKNR